jgi:hypothetical protein
MADEDAGELEQLRARAAGLETALATSRADAARLAQRLAEIEQSYSSLVSLFVASSQLHSTLDYVDVVRAINEILQNLIGASSFALYLFDVPKNDVVRIRSQGCDDADLAVCDTLANRVVASGELYVTDAGPATGGPAAGIPLKIGDDTMGAIVLHRLLGHKDAIGTEDLQILDVLGKSASMALYGAKLHTLWKVERRAGLREGELDLMPPPMTVNRRSVRP